VIIIQVCLTNQNSRKKQERNAHAHSPWPSLEGHDSEERQHGVTNIVKVEVVSFPFSLFFLLSPKNILRVSACATKRIKSGNTVYDHCLCITSVWYVTLYHAIENTVNQNTGKPLYIRRYYIQPSIMRRSGSYIALTVSAIVFSMAWYKIVIQRSHVVYHEISHLSLVFSWYTQKPKGSYVYQENTSDSWDISRYTTRKRWITSI